MQLSQDEIRLLRHASEGVQTIAGNERRDGLKRLVEAGWLTERSLNLSVTEYAITDAGRSFLSKQVSEHSIPVEDLNASNDE
jgi:hypothetical protein